MNARKSFLVAALLVVALLVAAGMGTSAAARQSTDSRTENFMRELYGDQLSLEKIARIRSRIEKISSSHPRLVRAVRKGKIPFTTYRNLDLKGELVVAFEAGGISVSELVNRVANSSGGEMHIQGSCYSNCETWTDFFVAGCFAGGGDLFTCFVFGETFLCDCRNGCTEESNYVYIVCPW